MSRRTKSKAVSHQNEIRDLLRHVFCPPFENDDIVSRPMGNPGSDIILSPAILQAFPFYIECKRHEDKTWNASYKKAFEQTFCNDYPLLIRRKSRSDNHFFAKTTDVLEIHPRLLVNEKIETHTSLKSFLTHNSFYISLYEDYVHFNTKKFMEILSCLRISYFQ